MSYSKVMVPQLTHEKSSACLASSFGNTACLSKRSSSSYMFPYMNPVVQRHITYYWVNRCVPRECTICEGGVSMDVDVEVQVCGLEK